MFYLVLNLCKKEIFVEVSLKYFCARICVKVLAENFLKARLACFCLENVVRGNAVQICPDFPAKRLSIFLKVIVNKRQLKWKKVLIALL